MKKMLGLAFALILSWTQIASAESKQILDMQIHDTVKKFTQLVPGAQDFLNRTEGYLVVPNLYKAGFVVGGEYGEGGLLVKQPSQPGQPPQFNITDYYSVLSASIGFQAGAQRRSLIIAFLTPGALQSFRQSNKWKVGVDGSVAFVDVGASMDLSTMDFKKTIVAFAFGNQGLMAGISLDGSVFTKIKK
ncbi:YSC84-related protein [Nitratifractor sp.]|uniref:lipid-binding SYLF domain-containing protein n=1 Tax=Nitratifractor sp. TaxID=2268144 RepID=UPI0025D6C505|nr:YSC84-related protein [Nitratifractor sp.]